jgi:hypothetical protein
MGYFCHRKKLHRYVLNLTNYELGYILRDFFHRNVWSHCSSSTETRPAYGHLYVVVHTLQRLTIVLNVAMAFLTFFVLTISAHRCVNMKTAATKNIPLHVCTELEPRSSVPEAAATTAWRNNCELASQDLLLQF